MHRIRHLIQKEFLQIRRDKTYLTIIFLMPFIQIIIFGYSVTSDVKNVPVAFVDMDRSETSRRLTDAFTANISFTYSGHASSEQEAKTWIDRGRVQAALVVPRHFQRDLRAGKHPAVQTIIDGVDGNTAGIILAYVNQVAVKLQQEWLRDSGLIGRLKEVHLTEIIPRMWYNASLESKNNIVPGIIGILLTMITSFLTSMGIVKEKEIGTLEQLMVTPIRKHELIIGKIIPFAVVGFLLMNVGVLGGGLIFGLWMKGSLLTLYLLTLIFLMSTLGLGIFASTTAHTQQQAMFITWFFTIFAILLSGFFIPIQNMPPVIRAITYLNPLRYYMVIIREIYLKGTPILYLWKQTLYMLVFGLVMILSASFRFQKRVG